MLATTATVATASLVIVAGPAHAASTVGVITTASPATTVGYQIFANLNLMNTTVTPTGTASFRLYGPGDTICSWPIFASTVAVTGVSINSSRFTTSQAGTYRWTTSYSGDANYTSTSTACSLDSADVMVSKARNVLKVTALAPVGGRIYASASLTGYSPNGTVTLLLTGPGNPFCSGTPIFTSTVQVNGAGSYVSAGFAPSTPGTYTWRASYSGDDDNRGSSITACMASGNTVTV